MPLCQEIGSWNVFNLKLKSAPRFSLILSQSHAAVVHGALLCGVPGEEFTP